MEDSVISGKPVITGTYYLCIKAKSAHYCEIICITIKVMKPKNKNPCVKPLVSSIGILGRPDPDIITITLAFSQSPDPNNTYNTIITEPTPFIVISTLVNGNNVIITVNVNEARTGDRYIGSVTIIGACPGVFPFAGDFF